MRPLSAEQLFGMVMNEGRSLHRQGYKELWKSMLLLANRDVPLDVFKAVMDSDEAAERLHVEFNASIAAKDWFRSPNTE